MHDGEYMTNNELNEKRVFMTLVLLLTSLCLLYYSWTEYNQPIEKGGAVPFSMCYPCCLLLLGLLAMESARNMYFRGTIAYHSEP